MSERELLHTDRVLVVEGKYDAARLSHLTDAMILLTDGFGIYKDKKRQQLLKALAKKKRPDPLHRFRCRRVPHPHLHHQSGGGRKRGAGLCARHPWQGKAEAPAR